VQQTTVARGWITRRPEVALEPIASRATIDQVIRIIPATGGARLKMVNLQFAANFLFLHTTVATPVVIGTAHRFTTLLFVHR
jgi:hypothetical protein